MNNIFLAHELDSPELTEEEALGYSTKKMAPKWVAMPLLKRRGCSQQCY